MSGIKTGILQQVSGRNNLYYAYPWDSYHNFHAQNIVLPWLNSYAYPELLDWESYIKKGLDGWNDAGGFDWLNGNDDYRKGGLQSAETRAHQQLIRTEYPGLNEFIANNSRLYKSDSPELNTADRATNGVFTGVDMDFGIQTGNRRPTIYKGVSNALLQQWSDFYKKLGYTGRYLYLDHWVPTKLFNNATMKNYVPFDSNGNVKNGTNIGGLQGDYTSNEEFNSLMDKQQNSIIGKKDYGLTGLEPSMNNPTTGFGGYLRRLLPNFIAAGRLGYTLWNNNRIYDELLKGLVPDLAQSFHTYSQVVGDEATRQGYYNRATLGLTLAAKPFTSDADRQMAYLMEAKNQGDLLRALGDLADNQMIFKTSQQSLANVNANRQRDTEVANANISKIVATNQARHNLRALKYFANGTSIDNAALALKSRLLANNREVAAYQDELNETILKWQLYSNEEYLKLNNELNQLKLNPVANAEAIRKKEFELQTKINNLKYKILQSKINNHNIIFAKKGGKTTEELIYHTTKDAVEHFREMIKILNKSGRKKIKIEKLKDSPKIKYLQGGGIGPFMVYRPATVGSSEDSSTASQSRSGRSSSSSSGGPNNYTLVKDLFSNVNGLPAESDYVLKYAMQLIQPSSIFSNSDLDTDSLATNYLMLMSYVDKLKFNKDEWKRAEAEARNNDALKEFAIDSSGRFIVQMPDATLNAMSWREIENARMNGERVVPLTNNDLLNLRAYNPDLKFNNSVLDIVSNGIGLNKIKQYINSLIPSLGRTTEEGFIDKHQGQVLSGIRVIQQAAQAGIAAAPDGTYVGISEELNLQAKMAVRDILNSLPLRMRSTLLAYADMSGTTIENMVIDAIGSRVSSSIKFLPFKDPNDNSSSSSSNKSNKSGVDLDAATSLILGNGYLSPISLNPGTSYEVTVNGRFSLLQKHSGENMGDSTLADARTSTLGGVLDWNRATLAGSRLHSTAFDRIFINTGEVVGMDLPIDEKGNPDFTMLKNLEELDKQMLLNNVSPDDYEAINDLCKQLNIPAKYANADGQLNTYNWGRFAAIQVTTDEAPFEDTSVLLEDVLKEADGNSEELYENKMKQLHTGESSKDFSVSGDVYLGTIFIPIKPDIVNAVLSSGQNITAREATNLQMQQYGYDTLKVSTYVSPKMNASNL